MDRATLSRPGALACLALACASGCASGTQQPSAPLRPSACSAPERSAAKPAPLVTREPEWGARIERVDIVGRRRIPLALVRGAVASRPGALLDETRVRADVLALDALEVFEDIAVESTPLRGGVALRFIVRERPTVARVEQRGPTRLPKGGFVLLAPGDLHDPARLARSAHDLEKRLADAGHPEARVAARARGAGIDRVDVCYDVQPGPKRLLATLDFTGNQHASSAELRALFDRYDGRANRPGAPYRADLIDTDSAHVTALYWDRGFVEARLGAPRVTAERGRLRVEIPVEEGPRYRFGQVRLGGKRAAELGRYRLAIRSGEPFSRSKIIETVDAVREQLRARRIDAEVTLDPHVDDQKHQVDLVVKVEKAQ